jgi:hypothetical protein
MSSRALRRLQKQQEEQRALQQAEEEKSEDEVATAKSKQSAFALLNDADQDEDEFEVEETTETAASKTPSQRSAKAELTPAKPKKKKKRKGKSKAAGDISTQGADKDDFDALLASVAQSQNGETDTLGGEITPDVNRLESLLSVDTHNLHAINEMRRLFGRDAIDDRPRQPQQLPRRRDQRVQQERRGFPAVSLKRNIFVQGKEEWPRATTSGLSMEIVDRDPQSGATEYRFVHSTAYQDTQRQYEIAVASMDPQRLLILLQHNPYHIAT